MSSVRVTTPQAVYDVTIAPGLLRTLYPRIKKLNAHRPPRTFVITSPQIWALWHQRFLASFPTDAQPPVLFLPAGERYKRLAQVEALAQQLVHAGADRDSILLAFGGGIIGDLTGFLAAIYMRGIRYVGIPSTILAQVDSSLGGKTGVNLTAGKNLIGSFHHPLAVFSDIDTLATLPPAELRAGLQEAVKAGIIYDPRLFAYMEKNADAIAGTGTGIEHRPSKPGVVQHTGKLLPLIGRHFSAGNKSQRTNGALAPATRSFATASPTPDPAILARIITAAVRVKADVVSRDEKESGLRMILNFGHTIGHAVEAATQYRKLLHGEAVAWGSIAALHVSLNRGRITRRDFDRMAACILRYGPVPPFRIAASPQADPARLVALTAGDKKKRSGRRAFVLTTGIGGTEIAYDVTDAELLTATRAMFADMKEQCAT